MIRSLMIRKGYQAARPTSLVAQIAKWPFVLEAGAGVFVLLLAIEGNPDDVQDGRIRALRSIALRRGQQAFRSALLDAYESRCAITGCDCTDALEAAHVYPYHG